MANTLINSSGFTSGISSAETGINVSSIKLAIEPEFRTERLNIYGAIVGWAIGPVKLEVDIEGEIAGNTGWMAATFVAAVSIANTTLYWGAPTTGLYPISGTVDMERANGAWLKMSMKAMANAGVA